MPRAKVFISYSRADADWLATLHTHLKPLVRAELIDVWDDTRIGAGAVWQDEIAQALRETRVGILLVSPEFLASDFIAQHEIPELIRASVSGALLLCVHVRHASTHLAEYSYTDPATGETHKRRVNQYHALNTPDKPLATLSAAEADKILVDIAGEIARLGWPRPVQPNRLKTIDVSCWGP